MIYPSLVTAALFCVWGTAAYMSVSGLIAIFGGQPVVAGCLAAGMELGKLLAVVHLHRNWSASRWIARAFYIAVIAALVSVTAIEAAGYLIQSYRADTTDLTVQRAELAGLVEAGQHLRYRIEIIDANLSQLPDGYVSRRIHERNAVGYDALQQQLADNLSRQQVLDVAIAAAETDAGPITAISNMTGISHRNILLVFVVVIVSIMEPLSIGLAVAASVAWRNRTPTKYELQLPLDPPPRNKSKWYRNELKTAGQTAKAAEAATPAIQNGQKRPSAGQPATAAANAAKENGHAATPINKEFARLIVRHGLKKQDIADITGRKQLETVESWLNGKQEIPVKALRALRKWAAGRPAVRLVKRPAAGGGVADGAV